MDRLIVSDNGFPGTKETWEQIDEMSKQVTEALGATLGLNTIVFGVVDDGTNISDGYITYDGELLPFVGAASQPNVEVVEVITDAFYDNATTSQLPVHKKRFARPTADGSARPLVSFDRIASLDSLASVHKIGRFAMTFIDGLSNYTTFSGAIINVERVQFIGDNIRYKVTLPERLNDYVPYVSHENLLGQNHRIRVGGITPTSFWVHPQGLNVTDNYSNTFDLYILE